MLYSCLCFYSADLPLARFRQKLKMDSATKTTAAVTSVSTVPAPETSTTSTTSTTLTVIGTESSTTETPGNKTAYDYD